MTSPIPNSELQDVVERVLRRMVGEQSAAAVIAPAAPPQTGPAGKRAVAIGGDHGGFAMKEALKKDLEASGYDVVDCGTGSAEAVDYPDFAHKVASLVGSGRAWRGVMIDGAGIGSCMVANKVPGVRAAMAYNHASAASSREHNDANVLTLGAGLIGLNLARQILKTWLETDFGGGRHAPRVEKISAVEKQYLKGS